MSRTLAILLALALVWMTAWQIAGCSMRRSADEKQIQAAHVETPATRLVPGAEARVEATTVDGPSVTSPYGEKDGQGRQQWDSALIATRRAGPATLQLAVGDTRIELPVERWVPRAPMIERIDELPARLGVSQAEIDAATEKVRGTPRRYLIRESTLQGQTRYFVVGRLERGEGPLRLEADPVLGRVELHSGTHAELVEALGRGAGGLRVTAWILSAGVGPLPLAVVGLVLLARRRKRA